MLNFPCKIAVESGAIFLEDGSLLAESLFPSAGETDIAHQLGGGLRQDNFERLLLSAPAMSDGIWAPVLSRWSTVYFHLLSESLVANHMFAMAGLAKQLRHPCPSHLEGARKLLKAEVYGTLIKTDAPIIQVPRVLLSSDLYDHAILGGGFRSLIESLRIEAVTYRPRRYKAQPERIYISRTKWPGRELSNENLLTKRLAALGFSIFEVGSRSLRDQVHYFSNASVVAGPFGSGLTNAAFARPGVVLCDLRPLNAAVQSPLTANEFKPMTALLGGRYCAHVFENAPSQDAWQIDVDEAFEFISSALRNV